MGVFLEARFYFEVMSKALGYRMRTTRSALTEKLKNVCKSWGVWDKCSCHRMIGSWATDHMIQIKFALADEDQMWETCAREGGLWAFDEEVYYRHIL